MAGANPAQSTQPQAAQGRIARLLVRAAQVLGILLVAVLVLVAGTVLYLRTESGLARLARLIEAQVSSDRMTLSIGSLKGAFPEHLRVENVALTDAQGTLVSIDYADLSWQPLDLLGRRLAVDSFDIGTVTVNRLPPSEPAPPSAEPGPSGLPSLPVDIAVDRFQLAELRLSEAIVGQAVRLTAAAALAATRRGEFTADATVRRLDGVAAQVVLAARYDRAADYLKIDLDANEPEGGVVATLAGLPGTPPVHLTVKGEGPLDAWQGDIGATAGSLAAIDARVSIAGQDPRHVGVEGKAAIAQALPADLAPLLTGGIDLRAAADVFPERIAVSDLTLSTAGGKLEGHGNFLTQEEQVDAELALTLGPASVLQAVVPGVGYDTAGATVAISGRLPVPKIEADARATKLTLDKMGAGELSLRAKVTPAAEGEPTPPLDVQAEIAASGLVPPSTDLAPLLKEPARAVVDGRYDQQANRLLVRALRLAAGPLQAEGTADVQLAEPPTGTAALTMEASDIAPFGPLLGAPVAGRARLAANFAAHEKGDMQADIEGGIDGFSSAARELATLIGDSPRLTARVRGNAASNIDLDANVKAAQFTAAAEGQLAADMTVLERANLKIAADDLSGLRPLVGAPIGGSFNLTADAQGPLERLTASLRAVGQNIVYQDERIDRLQLAVDARDVPSSGAGTLALDAATSRGPITAQGAFKTEGQERLHIERLVLTYAQALTASARLLVPLDGRPIDGTIAVRSDDLAPVGRANGVPLAGRINLDVLLQPVRDEQRLAAVLRADDLRYGPPAAPTVGVGKLGADIEVADALVQRRLRAGLTADEVTLADGHLTRAAVQATGANDAYRLHGDASGDLQGLTQLTTDADIRLAPDIVVTLQHLRAEIRDEWLRLVRPARLTLAGERMTVDDLALAYGSAEATLSAAKSPQRVDGRLAVRDLDLRLVEKFQPGTHLRGVVRADATLSGAPAAPVISLDARATDLGMGGGSRPRIASRSPSLSATLQGRVGGGRADVDLVGEGLGEVPLRVNLSAPVRFAVEPFAFQISETGPISGSAVWRGSVDPVWQLLPIDAFLLSGDADIDLAFGGTIRQPAATGEIALTRGSFEVFETGTVLRPLDVAIAAAPGEVRITRLEARDGGSGTLTGSGAVALGQPQRIDTRVAFKEFAAVRRDDVVSRLNGGIAVNGAIGGQMLVSGRIENAETEIRLINRLPPQVTTVPVVFVDEVEAAPSTPAAPETETPAPPVDLDLTIDLPGRVYVRGRGLSSEWAGSFYISGTSANPQVRGSLHPVRGTFDFLGKTFTVEKGKIDIPGLDQDIMIDLTAAYQRSDFKALVHVSGTAKEPKITLESEPELPQDEILARVLFDKSTGKLSALEAAQLAAAAAELASGEPGVLDKLRTATGLDLLRLGGAEDPGGIGAVEAGKYVGEDVYVGVEQGASATSTAAVVEVDITDNVKLRSTTSAEGSNRVGVRWEWEY